MWNDEDGRGCQYSSTTMNEELGQIDYVFTKNWNFNQKRNGV